MLVCVRVRKCARQAYLSPVVNDSTKPFTFRAPDFRGIIAFCSEKLFWTEVRWG